MLIVAALAVLGAGCETAEPTDTGSGSGSSSGSSPALTGKRVYLAERTPIETGSAALLGAFDLVEDGSLAPVSGSPFPLGSLGQGNSLEHAEVCHGFLYVATDDHGATPVSILGYALADSAAPVFVSVTPSSRVTHLACYEDRFLYAVSGTSILAFEVLVDGTLQSTTGHVPVASLAEPRRLEARGGHLFAFSDQDQEVRVYGLDEASGALSHPPEGPAWPQAFWLLAGSASPDGAWFASTDLASTQNRHALRLSSVGADGALAVVPPADIVDPDHLWFEKVSWAGTHLLVTTSSPAQVRSYDVSASGGVTVPPASVLELDLPVIQDIVVDASGSRAFLLMQTQDIPVEFSVAVLDVSSSGVVTLAPGSPVALGALSATPQLLVR